MYLLFSPACVSASLLSWPQFSSFDMSRYNYATKPTCGERGLHYKDNLILRLPGDIVYGLCIVYVHQY